MVGRLKYGRGLDLGSRKQKMGESLFEFEASVKRRWEIFPPSTRDIGTDYMIQKGWAKLQIQLRSACIGADGRYGIHLSKSERDPDAFFVYLLIHVKINAEAELGAALERWPPDLDFYIIPTTDMTKELEPWKAAFKTGTWKEDGATKANLTLDQIEESWEKYKGEKGWLLLEELAEARPEPPI